jgi:hypothetical protein
MNDNFIEKIIEDMQSNTPAVIMQTIISGIDQRVTDERFINAVKEHENDETCLLNVPISYVAKAALDVLGAETYNGKNEQIKNMINAWK